MTLVCIPAVLTYTRPSRSRPGQQHVVLVDGPSLAPLDCEHPCTCPAGQAGRFCWATLEILQVECVAEAGHRYHLVSDDGKPEAEHLLRQVTSNAAQAELIGTLRTAKGGGA